MSKQRGNANRTSGVAASSPVTGLLPFATMTCEESAQATPRASMSSAAASPVRTCLTRGRALASRVSAAVCGTSSRESFANYDRESSSWRTSQRSLLGDWTPFSEAFPKRGMMRSGLMSALPMSERRTDASDSSSSRGGEMWPTPAAMMPNDSEDPQEWLARAALLKEKHHNGNGAGTPLAVAVKLAQWPTPDAPMGTGGRTGTRGAGPTGMRPDGTKVQVTINAAVASSLRSTWPTARASDGLLMGGAGADHSPTLTSAVKHGAAAGAALSPAWVERLMGFPDDWTSPLIDGPSAPTKRSPKTSPRASRAKSR